MLRAFLHIAIYAVFGGAVFAFAAVQNPRGLSFLMIAGIALAAALFSGVLAALMEQKVLPLPSAWVRFGIGAAIGALSLGGFACALSFVARGEAFSSLSLVGALAGALLQGGRAFSTGSTEMPRTVANDSNHLDASPGGS